MDYDDFLAIFHGPLKMQIAFVKKNKDGEYVAQFVRSKKKFKYLIGRYDKIAKPLCDDKALDDMGFDMPTESLLDSWDGTKPTIPVRYFNFSLDGDIYVPKAESSELISQNKSLRRQISALRMELASYKESLDVEKSDDVYKKKEIENAEHRKTVRQKEGYANSTFGGGGLYQDYGLSSSGFGTSPGFNRTNEEDNKDDTT